MGFWTALLLSAIELAMIAGAGHAAAETGWPGYLHIFGDGVHLLAAGAWVGGLLALALLFAAARRDNSSACVLAARAAALEKRTDQAASHLARDHRGGVFRDGGSRVCDF
jgi:putative copper export protein